MLAFLTRFKQICNHPAHWLGQDEWPPSESGKLARLAELCESIASRQEKVLVFTQFRQACAPLAEFLAGVFGRPGLVLHGGTRVKQRQALVTRFQEDEDAPFFVLSLKAGGTGLNLTAASHVIHFDRWWNPAVEDQATDRAYRIGQRQNVLVHKFVCRGTVEERIEELLLGKRQLSAELLAGDGGALLTSSPTTSCCGSSRSTSSPPWGRLEACARPGPWLGFGSARAPWLDVGEGAGTAAGRRMSGSRIAATRPRGWWSDSASRGTTSARSRSRAARSPGPSGGAPGATTSSRSATTPTASPAVGATSATAR